MDAPTAKDPRITGAARAELRGQMKTAYERGASARGGQPRRRG